MDKNAVLIVILIAIAAIIVLDIALVLNSHTEKPQIIAKFTENFTIPFPSYGSHSSYREAAQAKTPSLADCLTAAFIHTER